MPPPAASNFEKECFFITPIGAEGTLDRARADTVMKHIVRPAVVKVRASLKLVRADEISAPGPITHQVIEHCIRSRVAVADLTSLNPNVLYELGLRHGRSLPTVLISETKPLPFDISTMRTVFFDHRDLESAKSCTDELAAQLKHVLAHGEESPLTYLDLRWSAEKLTKGNAQDRSIAAVLHGIDRMMGQMRSLENGLERLGDRVEVEMGGAEFALEGSELLSIAWVTAALSLLGPEMREIVSARLGLKSGAPMTSAEVAAANNIEVHEVDETVVSALRLWSAESFHEATASLTNELARSYRQLLHGQQTVTPHQ